ncbi:hypothetical protein PSTT_01702 [Puccinia striiformis]|uniref:Uncharacterized protein n=1 Tax=Puccinia striiformis TaxID=27350 RepID=A0A2S4W2P4_9BASI|nr:hypothetical protein PSTT_01702 [Puccinia striiformis]
MSADSNTTLVTLKSILHSFDDKRNNTTLPTLPLDVRTATDWLKIEPSIYRTLCCPGCFKISSPTVNLKLCDHRETLRSRGCNAELFNHQKKPIRQYSTQSFQEWIIKFIQRNGTEDLLRHSINSSNSSNDPSFLALIAAVCDLPAIRKSIGYVSHSSEMFCSFCYLPQSQNLDLNYATWPLRTIEGHKAESEAWKSATTHAQREDTFKTYGVRWSVLNELRMISWHAMRVWCLKEIASDLKDKKTTEYSQPTTEDYFDKDKYKQQREDERYSPPKNVSGINLRSLQDALMEINDNIQADANLTSDPCYFSTRDLSTIRWVIKHTEIPSWLNQPSPIFGDAAAGKVCLADWISFFTIFMPFAIVELDQNNQHKLVNLWYHLAMLTDIAMDYITDQNKIHRYLFHLTSYQSNIAESHPHLNLTPNQHMAYHIPRQLQNFGPSNFLASWHFEQINGILQQCPTNNKIAQLDFTLLKHAGRASNLEFIEEQPVQTKIEEVFLSKFKNNYKIPPYLYARLIGVLKLNKDQESRTKYVREYEQRGKLSPHEVPVPTLAKTTHRFKHLGLTYTDSLGTGSSSIEYTVSGITGPCFGKIKKIFQTLLCVHKGKHEVFTFFCVQRLEKLSPQDQAKNPYNSLCPDLNVHLFYDPPSLPEKDGLRHCDLITPQNIIYHTATFRHDSKIFNTEHNLIAVKSLSRGRHEKFV